jgi:hypothetical protein
MREGLDLMGDEKVRGQRIGERACISVAIAAELDFLRIRKFGRIHDACGGAFRNGRNMRLSGAVAALTANACL